LVSGRDDEQLVYNFASDEDEDEEGYDDEDDENAENNWRNDYPDEDPMYFERLHLDDYSSGDDSGFAMLICILLNPCHIITIILLYYITIILVSINL
jgi:hypothetical protein